jgi:hypothetical protein
VRDACLLPASKCRGVTLGRLLLSSGPCSKSDTDNTTYLLGRSCQMMSFVNLLNQLPVLLGVTIGALGSYLTTAASERARWRRTLDSRWDDRRTEAYASFAQAVNQKINIAKRIAAGRGLGGDSEPLAPTQKNLNLLAAAEAERARQWETVLLLGHPLTVAAARNWHEHAWRLEWYARALIAGENSDWEQARAATDVARATFYESARSDLRVGGGSLPDRGAHDERVQRIRGDPPL